MILVFLWSLVLVCCHGYKIGIGRADMTGPSVEVAFMGYANPDQRGQGIHLRQFARAFIIDDGNNRLVFVCTDAGMMGTGVRKVVLERLQTKFNKTYNEQNVMLSGTHSHSTPGGFLLDIAFDLNSMGFVQETFDAYVNGIVRSIERAHQNLKDGGKINITRGKITNANINRSPTSYLNNPPEERAKYDHNTDQTFVQLKFTAGDNKPQGVLTWFAVHPTSMNNTNRLVSSDNVGYASLLFEQEVNKGIPGQGDFVAAFASTNLGDVSPNIMGPKCQLSGLPCDSATSTCANPNERCVASGPGRNMEESTYIIAHRIFYQALAAWRQDGVEVTGKVLSVHQYVDMPKQNISFTNPATGKTLTGRGCSPAMGYSFAAGTTDGPGMFSFKQGTKSTNPLWNIFTDILAKPTPEMVKCQAPKPILLATGEMNFPFEWQPSIVSTHLGMIGNVALACVPGEFTTMSGRRMRETLGKVIGIPSENVVIAGLCNTYSDYIATPEEYQIQRYEGASTIFGPQTLNIYLYQYSQLAKHLLAGTRPEAGPDPPVVFKNLISLLPGVVYDYAGWGKKFGDVKIQPQPSATPNQTVSAVFVSGNPRNDLRQEESFLTVEKLKDGSSSWEVIATDANWETKLIWKRLSTLLGTSEVEVRWTIPSDTEEGTYRFRHYGSHRQITGKIGSYGGASLPFQVTNDARPAAKLVQ